MADTQTAIEKAKEWFGVEPYDSLSAIGHAAGILDVVKQEWGEAWTEHDQKTRAGLSVLLQAAPPVAMSEGAAQTAEWISKVSEKADKYRDLARDARAEERWELSDYNDGVAFGLLLALRMMKGPPAGADPDGDEDWRLAQHAVSEVKRLREENDALEAKYEAAQPWLPQPDSKGWWWRKFGPQVRPLEVNTLDDKLYVPALGSFVDFCGGLWQKVADPR